MSTSAEGPRPTTAAPPPTAQTAAPTTANTARTSAYDGDAEADDDDGMFNFLPPIEGSPKSNSGSSSFPIGVATEQQNPLLNAGGPSLPDTSNLTPAAAYAIRSQIKGPDGKRMFLETSDGLPVKPSSGRRESDSSSAHDGLTGQYGGRWEDQARSETSTSYGIDRDGHAMPSSGVKRPTRSEDLKILAEAGDGYGMEGLDMPGYDFEMEMEDEEDSPFAEVRASVSNLDDPEMPVLTFRAWFLGLGLTTLVAAVNQFFYLRYPAPYIQPIILQIVVYPLGKIMAWLLPVWTWQVPKRLQPYFGDEVSLNPGPFNIKEHTIILMMVNAAGQPNYALNFKVATEKFYGVSNGFGFDVMLVLSTQLIGFGVAGILRRFLVWPAALIWPQNLVYCTLLNTLHAEEDAAEEGGGGVTRFRFFMYVFAGAFAWYFLPGFLFGALSYFSFICWAAPNNVVVNQLFGVSSGLGMSVLSFDWAQITYIGSPLIIPWWAEVNIFVGFVIAFWIVAPILYYTNTWDTAYLPLVSSSTFDRFGTYYNTSAVLDLATNKLDVAAYEGYSQLFLPVTYILFYSLTAMLATAAVVHTVLHHGSSIWRRMRAGAQKAEDDIHMKLMRHYPEVPDWWYYLALVIFLAISIATVASFDYTMPVWALIVSLLTALLYVIPGGYIYAMTSQSLAVNFIVDAIGGFITPGDPFAFMLFKIYSLTPLSLGLLFVQDLKLGHYQKIPPRATFTVQMVAVFVAAVVQAGLVRWLFEVVPDICTEGQKQLLSCPNGSVFFSSSIIWGLIGPERQFGWGKTYNIVLWMLLVGAVLPIPFWILAKKYPKSWVALINIPVLINGTTYAPPATGINYSAWFLAGTVFQFWMRRRHFRWWSKFNFVLSAGLDSGTILSGIFIFFALYLPKSGTISVNWWGNKVFTETADWNGVPYLTPPADGFGPTSW